ncbi:MAG: hypothetical protein DMG11_29675 [Acidobacteria bacterium]|nr:MAG: hypothetical protein DMG11_29675 [Acidobacteriota bacterium]
MRKVRSIIRHGAETFIIESPKLISQMRAAIEAADCVGLQRIAHAYKGSVSAFSAGAVQRLNHSSPRWKRLPAASARC